MLFYGYIYSDIAKIFETYCVTTTYIVDYVSIYIHIYPL